MPKNENAHEHERDDRVLTLHERAVEHARADVADHDALCSTDERTRPVTVTSTHEAQARADRSVYAVTVVRRTGQRTVTRVLATDVDDAVRHAAVAHDVEPHELVVDVVERESAGMASAAESTPQD